MLVYKYRGGSFERDLQSLEKDQFWASQTQQLNDPCEGLISIQNYEKEVQALNLIFPQQANSTQILKKLFQNILDMKDHKLGIFSLSKSYTDELLWAHYAYSHQGFCIEYDLEKLLRGQIPAYRYFDVSYITNIPDLSFKHIISQKDENLLIKTMLGYKSKRWEYENEIRIITENYGLQNYDYRAIKSIYFGLKMSNDQIEEMMKSLQGRQIKYFQMHLKSNSFEFEAKAINDKYPTTQRYKYSIAPMAEELLSFTISKEGYEKFSPYLQKMAEIVRREPDCYEVTYVDLSFSKSTLDNPIFFAQYKTQKNELPITLHYSLEQINEDFKQIDDL